MACWSPELQWAAQRGLFTANKANTDTYAGKGVQMAQNCSHSVCLSCLVVKKNAENKALFETTERFGWTNNGQLVGKQNMWNEREKIRECSQHEDLDSDNDLIYVASPRDESFKWIYSSEKKI